MATPAESLALFAEANSPEVRKAREQAQALATEFAKGIDAFAKTQAVVEASQAVRDHDERLSTYKGLGLPPESRPHVSLAFCLGNRATDLAWRNRKATELTPQFRQAQDLARKARWLLEASGEVHPSKVAKRPHTTAPRSRGRERRPSCNNRTRGSRRASCRAGPGGDDPDESDSEPPGLRLWRHPRFGSCSPNLLRVLVEAGR